VLVWLSVWSAVQTCIWPSWCHCHSLSLASVKSRSVLPFWYWPTRVVLEKGSLNVCVCVCVHWKWKDAPHHFCAFTHTMDEIWGSMFSRCLSVCACVHLGGGIPDWPAVDFQLLLYGCIWRWWGNTVENRSVLSLIRMRWLPSAWAYSQQNCSNKAYDT